MKAFKNIIKTTFPMDTYISTFIRNLYHHVTQSNSQNSNLIIYGTNIQNKLYEIILQILL